MANIRALVDFGGVARADQQVSVFNHGTQTLSGIFDRNGVALPNPTTVDQTGHVQFYAPAGSYDVVGPDITRTVVLSAPTRVLAGPAQMLGSGSFDVKAVGATVTDLPGMSLAVPDSASGVFLRAKFEIQANTGTSVAGSQVRVIMTITDDANNVVAAGQWTGQQVIQAATVLGGQINLEKYLPAPVTAKTYKIRVQLSSTAPTNWTSVLVFPANGNGGANSEDNFYATAT